LTVPAVSILITGRLIARFGIAPVGAGGLAFVALSSASWAVGTGLEPDLAGTLASMVLMGIGVGLALPTLMGAGAAALPPSAFATGSGVLNMIRQTGMAIGVAVCVALIGSPQTPTERLQAFQSAWWAIAVVALAGLVPLLLLRQPKRAQAPSPAGGVPSSGPAE
jgi:MFS family permease